MTCPRCGGKSVTTKDRPYVTAYMKCLRCFFEWRKVRGRAVERERW